MTPAYCECVLGVIKTKEKGIWKMDIKYLQIIIICNNREGDEEESLLGEFEPPAALELQSSM